MVLSRVNDLSLGERAHTSDTFGQTGLTDIIIIIIILKISEFHGHKAYENGMFFMCAWNIVM